MYDPSQLTSYIIAIDANYLYGWAMSQEMADGDFEFVSQDECFEIKLLMNYADGAIAIFNLGIFKHRVTDDDKKVLSWTRSIY